MRKSSNKAFVIWSVIIVAIVVFITFLYTTNSFAVSYDTEDQDSEEVVVVKEKEVEKKIVKHVETPQATKSIYMSACVLATPSFRDELVKLVEETELNSIIIDIKDFSGSISHTTELAGKDAGGCSAPDVREFIETLHEKNIYVIGRITVFQDPFYTKSHPELAVKKQSDGSVWKDYKGLSFIDVGAKPYWEYIVKLSKESYDLGYDELNFDYIRFPSDGNMKDISFPYSNEIISLHTVNGKAYALESFFKYLQAELKDTGVVTSADIFGMTTTNTDDLNIGQLLEFTVPYFDYVAPMVYPSHYPPNFNGYADPNDYPYEIIHFSMSEAFRRVQALKIAESTPQHVKDFISTDQLRPWLQDFDYGGDYGPAEVREQIQATYDSGLDSWMLWAPSNRYTKAALQLE